MGRGIICWLLTIGAALGQGVVIPIEVSNLPASCEWVVARSPIDFSKFAEGAIDERSIRLYRVAGAQKTEIPYQFSSFEQPRPKQRQLLPETKPSVSYVTEFRAGEKAPGGIKVAGELTWIIDHPNALYVLEATVPKSGAQVQTPFPPQNLRALNEEGLFTPVRWFPKLQLHPQYPRDGVIHFYDGRDLVTSYHIAPTNTLDSIRRPFFYPVIGPDGIGLTEFGKPHDPTGSHAHHYSLWIAHHSVNEISFWGERAGTIANESIDLMEDGPIFSRVVQRTRWNDLLRETRTITLYSTTNRFRAIDIEMSFACAGSNSVTFGKTSFGFLAARVAQSMTVFDGAGEIRTSEGALNERGAHLTRGRWLDQSGPIAQDKWGGIAILDHPDNPHFPTGWHCRNDGWAGAAFNMDAPYTLEPGKTLRLKYRVLLHSGNAVDAHISQRFSDWAAKPAIKF